jgi:hypothetical protein
MSMVWWRDDAVEAGQGVRVPYRRGYPSDLTDAQWDLVEGLLPEPSVDGRPEKHPRREIVDAILYLVRSAARGVPAGRFAAVADGVLVLHPVGRGRGHREAAHDAAGLSAGREPEPSAGVLDSQSVKGAGTVGKDSRGYDPNKKINGRKRSIVTDTAGLLIAVGVLAASWQDRDGGKTALLGMYLTSPIRHVLADQGFAGRFVDWARDTLKTTVKIVRKPAE